MSERQDTKMNRREFLGNAAGAAAAVAAFTIGPRHVLGQGQTPPSEKLNIAGIGIGGEYGEGALRIGGKTADYYSTAAASIGLQRGAQAKTVIILFLQQEALDNFRNSKGWEAGVDGSVALVKVGAGGSIDTTNIKDPIIGFVIGQKGLMFNVTLEGAKFTKIVRK